MTWLHKKSHRLLLILLSGGLMLAAGGWWGADWLVRYEEEERLYRQYFPFYYAAYKKSLPDADAWRYANHYARFYAEYYSSRDYENSLLYALPEVSQTSLSYPAGPVAHMRITPDGLALIKQFEGLRTTPYRDVGGKLTIGYGHLVRRGEYFTTLNETQAEHLLSTDLQLAEAIVKRWVRVPLSEPQYSALVSFAFNVGEGQFSSSTLVKRVNQQDFRAAAKEFARWNKVNGRSIPGLDNRREAERAMFAHGRS